MLDCPILSEVSSTIAMAGDSLCPWVVTKEGLRAKATRMAMATKRRDETISARMFPNFARLTLYWTQTAAKARPKSSIINPTGKTGAMVIWFRLINSDVS
jgi:hypothetical protein